MYYLLALRPMGGIEGICELICYASYNNIEEVSLSICNCNSCLLLANLFKNSNCVLTIGIVQYFKALTSNTQWEFKKCLRLVVITIWFVI